MTAEKFNQELSGVLAEFEEDFDRRQRAVGNPSGKILNSEKSVVAAFLLFMHGRGETTT